MSRSILSAFLILLILLFIGCSSGPLLKLNHCNPAGHWTTPKRSEVKTRIVTYQWRHQQFSLYGRYGIDLANPDKTQGFSCLKTKSLSVRMYKTWQDVLWNFIPFYYSNHFEVTY